MKLTVQYVRNMKKYLFFRDWTWYFLVNGTKRFIGQEDMESVIANLEEEAAVACKAYDEVVEVRDRLDGENTQVGPQFLTEMLTAFVGSHYFWLDGGRQEVNDGPNRGRARGPFLIPERFGDCFGGEEHQGK